MNQFRCLKVPLNIAVVLSLLIAGTIGSYSVFAVINFFEYRSVMDPRLKLTIDRFQFF